MAKVQCRCGAITDVTHICLRCIQHCSECDCKPLKPEDAEWLRKNILKEE